MQLGGCRITIKFDDRDLADLPLPPEDYGDANMEDGWVLIDEAEI